MNEKRNFKQEMEQLKQAWSHQAAKRYPLEPQLEYQNRVEDKTERRIRKHNELYVYRQ